MYWQGRDTHTDYRFLPTSAALQYATSYSLTVSSYVEVIATTTNEHCSIFPSLPGDYEVKLTVERAIGGPKDYFLDLYLTKEDD
jgi:hypothetical protein